MTFRFGSVCSGIEAASVAWHPLGWQAAWLSEIEPFPSAVLAHHYPDVPNLGDMTTIADRIRAGLVEAPDMLCGGTPCQAFSVAGQRRSLSDERGSLSLVFCELADSIDDQRFFDGLEPCIVFWENVPGVLSTGDNAFGCFLGQLAGEDCALEPPGGKWTDAGAVFGPKRAIAWRVLDAQYFGVAQRRRRVFVVASARKGFDPAQVLFEFDGVRRDSAPSREAREEAAGSAANGAGSRRWGVALGSGQAGAEILTDGGAPTLTCLHEAPIVAMPTADIVGCINSAGGHAVPGNSVQDAMAHQRVPMVTHSLRGEGFDASEDGTGRGTPLVPVAFDTTQITSAANYSNPQPGDPCHPLAAGAHPPAIAIRTAQTGSNGWGVNMEGVAYTLDSAQQAVAFAIQTGALRTNPNSGPDGIGVQADHAYTLEARAEVQAVAFGGQMSVPQVDVELSQTLQAKNPQAAAVGMAVRRLTPRECSRLQGFPDDYLGLKYADADEAHATQVLHELWREAGTPALEEQGWRTGIVAALLTPEILLAGVHVGWLSWEVAARCAAARGALPGEEHNQEGFVRALRLAGEAGRSPFGRESFEQLARELGSDLSVLPLEGAQAGAVLRGSRLWPEAQAKWPLRYALATGKAREKPDRLNPDDPRYKALGNSWAVPCVRWIGRRIFAELHKDDDL